MRFCEKNQIVVGVMPYDTMAAAVGGDFVSLKLFHHVVVKFVRVAGSAGEDPTITITQATSVAGAGEKALNFTDIYEKEGTTNAAGGMAAIGTFTKTTQTAANTYSSGTSGENDTMQCFEFDADELDVDNGFDCIRASISDPGSGTGYYGYLEYILTEARHKSDPVPSAIVN